jgi:hypothetical protein
MTTKKSPSDRSVVDKISDAIYPRIEKILESEREKGAREVLVQSLVSLGIATALMKLLVQHGLTPAVAIESLAKGHSLSEEQLVGIDRRLYRGIVGAVETLLGNEADLIGFRMDFSWRGKAPGGA